MPMIAFAALIIVSHLPNAWATVKQRILQAVNGRRHRRRNAPQHHLHNRTVVVIVTDDWPDRVPVTNAEMDVFGAWFGDLFDEMFRPCR